ncbi:DUF3307 domain-containing protein [Shinella curvata]|uniref:DUF3307 domain-containing protein n=1 Tax=Shinella curvata TaxID=1817964 RepID=A0ABT8X9U9_9HYPH|nr:DUF3307 domain-containing protein [Shinella curvata]MCJ8055096.1 DUF3307 domain-containing protein [Shinella curvata]MDO6120508.1 DUF3307 domain-containing protein [Shinella curvata]
MIDIPNQISTAWFAAASVAFLVKHYLADFLLQTDWMATGKDRSEGWLLPLAAHAGMHGAMTAVLFLVVAPPLVWLGLVDMLIHGAIDRLKSVSTRRKALTPRQTAFWWLFGLDQTLHHLTHIGLAIILAAAGSVV